MGKVIEELKPCPFCGGKATIAIESEGHIGSYYMAYCLTSNCDCEIGWEDTAEESARKWNTRV